MLIMRGGRGRRKQKSTPSLRMTSAGASGGGIGEVRETQRDKEAVQRPLTVSLGKAGKDRYKKHGRERVKKGDVLNGSSEGA